MTGIANVQCQCVERVTDIPSLFCKKIICQSPYTIMALEIWRHARLRCGKVQLKTSNVGSFGLDLLLVLYPLCPRTDQTSRTNASPVLMFITITKNYDERDMVLDASV